MTPLSVDKIIKVVPGEILADRGEDRAFPGLSLLLEGPTLGRFDALYMVGFWSNRIPSHWSVIHMVTVPWH